MESKKLVFNHYKAVIYMHPYFYKADNKTSEAMKKVVRAAWQSVLCTENCLFTNT